MLETIFGLVEKILELAEASTTAQDIVSAIFDAILALVA